MWGPALRLCPPPVPNLNLPLDVSRLWPPTPETQHLIWAEGSCWMEAFKAGSLLSLTGPGL